MKPQQIAPQTDRQTAASPPGAPTPSPEKTPYTPPSGSPAPQSSRSSRNAIKRTLILYRRWSLEKALFPGGYDPHPPPPPPPPPFFTSTAPRSSRVQRSPHNPPT